MYLRVHEANEVGAVLYFALTRTQGMEGNEEEDAIFEAFRRASIGRDNFVSMRQAEEDNAISIGATRNNPRKFRL
jgi:hypothetical protein